VRRAIEARSLAQLGPVVEEDAIELHLIAMSSTPPIFYWRPATLRVLEAVRQLRDEGIEAWSTMDAGANVHVICAPECEDAVVDRVRQLEGVHDVIRDGVGGGPRKLDTSLFEVGAT
jgi:diphosphomevalonate decarboxylase